MNLEPNISSLGGVLRSGKIRDPKRAFYGRQVAHWNSTE